MLDRRFDVEDNVVFHFLKSGRGCDDFRKTQLEKGFERIRSRREKLNSRETKYRGPVQREEN